MFDILKINKREVRKVAKQTDDIQNENSEEIIVDLKKKEDNKSISNLPKEEQDKIRVISDKLREELGIEETQGKPKTIEQIVEEKKQEKEEQQETQQTEEEKYSGFMKKYSKKDEAYDSASAGKYDSDLDFKLNRKIKKVYLPLPKKTKLILCAVAGALFVGLIASVAVALYKPPVPVTLSSVAITQPTKVADGKTYYLVKNVNVGDTVSYDNIYMVCKYSDGSTKKVEIKSSMATLLSRGSVQNGKFVEAGDVDYKIQYKGKSLTLRFVVKENVPQTISAFVANFNTSGESCIEVNKTDLHVDLTNRLVIKCTYADGRTKQLDISDCRFIIKKDSSTSEETLKHDAKKLVDNILAYNSLPTPTGEFDVRIYYDFDNGESTSTIDCSFVLIIKNV